MLVEQIKSNHSFGSKIISNLGETKILIAGMAESTILSMPIQEVGFSLNRFGNCKSSLLDFQFIEQAQKFCETDIDMIYLDSTKRSWVWQTKD